MRLNSEQSRALGELVKRVNELEGGVKQATTVANISAPNAGTIGSNFDQTEVQKIATLADANKTAINAILSALKTAGIMA